VARVRVGTSGFSYKEWKGLFYPEELSDQRFLSYYASRFQTVEIDSTFYRMPAPKTLETWRESTSDDFQFTLKAPQQITHRQRLRVPSEAVMYFIGLAPGLGPRLAFVQFQLPPFMKCDVDRLKAFLEVLPADFKASFEFRNDSWFIPGVYDLLRRHDKILCIHDTDEGCTPMEITTGSTCVRLRRSEYTPGEREQWRRRWREWAADGIDVYAYVKHKENPNAPLIALEFADGF